MNTAKYLTRTSVYVTAKHLVVFSVSSVAIHKMDRTAECSVVEQHAPCRGQALFDSIIRSM